MKIVYLNKKYFFIFILTLELTIIVGLYILFLHKNTKRIVLTPISKNYGILRERRKYLHNLKPNSKIYEKPDWLDRGATYLINSDGLNDSKNYSEEKRGVKRIIALGDSFTFGMYISTNLNWTELLETKANSAKLTEIEVINLGVPGYDTQYEYERFMLKGKKYDADVIIWVLNDFSVSKERAEYHIDKYYSAFTKDPTYYQETRNFLIKAGIKPEYLISPLFTAATIAYDITTKEMEGDPANLFHNKYLDKLESSYHKKLVYVYIGEEYPMKLSPNLAKRANNKNIYYFRPTFIGNDKYYLSDRHFNSIGHKEFSEELFDYLKKQKII